MKRLLLGTATVLAILLTHGTAFLASVGSHRLGWNGWITAAIYVAVIAVAWAAAVWSCDVRCFIAWAEDEPRPVRTPRPAKPDSTTTRRKRTRHRGRFRNDPRRFGNR